jgi:hypothetical protein
MATNMDNIAALYENLVDKGLKFLPFWNLVSIINKLYINIMHLYHIILDCKLLFIITFI